MPGARRALGARLSPRRRASPRAPRRRIFVAFASGSITYACEGCGRCCRREPILVSGPELAGRRDDDTGAAGLVSLRGLERPGPGRLVTLPVLADGCRFLAGPHGCTLHDAGKPRSCRLFPFSRLVEIDGLWALVPAEGCPWQASPDAMAEVSLHDAILAELEPLVRAGLEPRPLLSVTPLAPSRRLVLEERLRDAVSLGDTPASALEAARRIHRHALGEAREPPELDLWLDLLRCAGEPPPLAPSDARLFVTALPTLRLLLSTALPLADLPVALLAFELWLRALRELGPRHLSGEELLHLLPAATPLLRVLTYADRPVPRLPRALGSLAGPAAGVWRALDEHRGAPLGEALARLMRGTRVGQVEVLTALGASMPVDLFP